MEYLVAVILAIIGCCFNSRMTPPQRKILLGVILVYLIFILAFRYRVGMDTIGYMKTFVMTPDLDHFWSSKTLSHRHEPGYLLICAVSKLFTKDFWPVQLILAAITNTCIFIFLSRYCKNTFIGLLLFLWLQFLYFGTEVIRESAAVGIFLINIRNAEKGKWITYYLISLLSISLHYSAIITWFLPLARFIRPNILYVVLCITILGVTPLIERFNELLSISSISDRVSIYTSKINDVNLNWRLGEFLKTGVPAAVAFIMCRLSKIDMRFRHFILIQILLCCGAFAIPVIFQRFTNYTTLFVTVTLANYLSSEKIKIWLKSMVICIIILSQSYYYYTLYPAWFPYISIFNPHNDPHRESLYHHIWN